MDIVGTLRLGWRALLFKEDAYEEMGASENPVVKGLILIVVVGLVIAVLGLIGASLEWASIPDLNQIRETVLDGMLRMPLIQDAFSQDPGAREMFEQQYNMNWQITQMFMPSVGSAALGIITTPLGLVIRWLVYGLLAYLFARWLGGSANLSVTLGVLALAVAPQALKVLTLLPFVEVGTVVSIWGILCAYVGLKTVHKLSWSRAVWATLLPYILVVGVLILLGCLGTSVLGVLIGGQS